jgi:phytol kinase
MLALAYSYGFVFSILGIATVLDKLKIFNDEGSRKFIHIGVSNWWIIAMLLFEPNEYYLAMIPPATFIVLNYLSYKFNLVKSMERDEQSANDLGTVYYAASLFIITFFAFRLNMLEAGAVAILAMGYGDGLAAVIGKHFKSKNLYQNKTLYGVITMFTSTLVIGFIFFPHLWALMIIVAIFATLVELYTPKGLDNLSVPLLIFLLLVIIL